VTGADMLAVGASKAMQASKIQFTKRAIVFTLI
jgi:hypothetical protein